MKKTDYNTIAGSYNKRYTSNRLLNIEIELKSIIEKNSCKNILEVGCGTGRWIKSLNLQSKNVFGLDYSFKMLKIARQEESNLKIINADADNIPFKNNYFDLIFCVNAIHHFSDKERFIRECNRTLKDKGLLAVFGVDPHSDNDWYIYKYFDNAYENDLRRFIPLKLLRGMLEEENFTAVEIDIVEKIYHQRIGSDVFNDPFLEKHSCSQLADLSDDDYKNGIEKIRDQIAKNPETIFNTLIVFYLIKCKKM